MINENWMETLENCIECAFQLRKTIELNEKCRVDIVSFQSLNEKEISLVSRLQLIIEMLYSDFDEKHLHFVAKYCKNVKSIASLTTFEGLSIEEHRALYRQFDKQNRKLYEQ